MKTKKIEEGKKEKKTNLCLNPSNQDTSSFSIPPTNSIISSSPLIFTLSFSLSLILFTSASATASLDPGRGVGASLRQVTHALSSTIPHVVLKREDQRESEREEKRKRRQVTMAVLHRSWGVRNLNMSLIVCHSVC